MKDFTDKHRFDHVFAVDDWVFLKIQSYVQCSITTGANQRLAFCYFGPYKVLHRVGAITYKLQRSENNTVHLLSHVSQVRQALAPAEQVQTQLPAVAAVTPRPKEILESRMFQKGGVPVPRVLIQWSDQRWSLQLGKTAPSCRTFSLASVT